jgi:hypothetical protein
MIDAVIKHEILQLNVKRTVPEIIILIVSFSVVVGTLFKRTVDRKFCGTRFKSGTRKVLIKYLRFLNTAFYNPGATRSAFIIAWLPMKLTHALFLGNIVIWFTDLELYLAHAAVKEGPKYIYISILFFYYLSSFLHCTKSLTMRQLHFRNSS